MRAVWAAVAVAVLLPLMGCSQNASPAMPDVRGKTLDVALSDVERAGFNDDVEVLGGGLLGVIDKSNWTVCEQVPAAGLPIDAKPRLQVDRTCGDPTPTATANDPTTARPTTSAAPTPSAAATQAAARPTSTPTSTPLAPEDEPPLTTENNEDFAALANLTDQCSDTQSEFAKKYAGRSLQFDGSIAALANHGSFTTRFDILVTFGDDGQGTKGPNFQFRDVNITYDLHLTGSNVPEYVNVGDNLRVTATVDEFEPKTCLFLLEPVSTEYR